MPGTAKKLLAAAVTVACATFATHARAVPIALELQLLVDVSGSVSTSEFNLQRTGYANAFQSASIQNAIANVGGIAVQFVYWSSSSQQQVAVDWTLVSDAASANSFANSILSASRPFSGGTAPQAAMAFGAPLFANNGFEGQRLVMDVSGDGTGENNSNGRDAALAAGVTTINGLVISPNTALTNYYNNRVLGGAGAQLFTAASFDDFGAAVQTKIGREIVGTVPEPGSLLLLGIAALAAARAGRRESRRPT